MIRLELSILEWQYLMDGLGWYENETDTCLTPRGQEHGRMLDHCRQKLLLAYHCRRDAADASTPTCIPDAPADM